MTRTVLRGGTVGDGTGAPGRVADVLVSDGRIADVGPNHDTSWFVPWMIVIGRSVVRRRVRQGTPRYVVSS